MARRRSKKQKSQSDLQEFVIVTFASDMEQAKNYETLLKTNDIPTMVNEQHEHGGGDKNIAVMVPEEFVDEAHVIIESQDAYEDFYDLALEEQDSDEFDSDIFEDEF